jgi:hypothetical protein
MNSSNPFAAVSLLGGGPKSANADQDAQVFKKKMSKLNENFLKFMDKNPQSNWKDGLQVKIERLST